MPSDSERANLLTYIGSGDQQITGTTSPPLDSTVKTLDAQTALWLVAAAHLEELARVEVIDEPAHAALAGALERVTDAFNSDPGRLRSMAQAIVSHWESLLPASLESATTLGLANEEWLATAARLRWMAFLHEASTNLQMVRRAAIALAQTHVVTIMPMFAGGRPAQPTTLGHYLGGLIEPLATNAQRLTEASSLVARSPLGAGLGIGDVFGVDRDDLARSLGLSGSIPNTLDAVGNVEDFLATIDAIESVSRVLHRFVQDVQTWIRTDPTSFVLDDDWQDRPESAHPTLVTSTRLETLLATMDTMRATCSGLRDRLGRVPYGSLGQAWDDVDAGLDQLRPLTATSLEETSALLTTGLVVNRAWLGNRAGRSYTTAGDLATFLMTEEEIQLAPARRISALVLAQVQKAGLEVSGITQDMIDSAALMTIGREIKVEMERLGRFLAPRRYIERRLVSGSPAPDMTRAWLADASASMVRDEERLAARVRSLQTAHQRLRDRTAAAAAAGSGEGGHRW